MSFIAKLFALALAILAVSGEVLLTGKEKFLNSTTGGPYTYSQSQHHL